MFLPVLFLLIVGGVTGLAIETNTPVVSAFGDKYLSDNQ